MCAGQATSVLLLGLLVVGASGAEDSGAGYTVEQVVEAWNTRAARLATVRVRWNDRSTVAAGAYEGLPSRKTTYENPFSLIIAGDSVRYDSRHMTHSQQHSIVPEESTRIWSDGELRALTQGGGIPYPRGLIQDSVYASRGFEQDPGIVPVLIAFRPLHPYLSTFRMFQKRFRLARGGTPIAGRRCVVAQEHAPAGASRASLFLDPDRDFAIMRMVVQDGNGREGQVFTFDEYREVEGQWVPTRWTARHPGTIDESAVTELSVNGRVDPQELHVDFPYGTWVRQVGEANSYIVKANGTRRVVSRRESPGATYDDLLRTESGDSGGDAGKDADEARRRMTIAAIRVSQIRQMRRYIWSGVMARDGDVQVQMKTRNAPDDGPREPARASLDDEAQTRLVFGIGQSEHSARRRLAELVSQNIERIDRVCRLTDRQKEKLALAGRRDSERFFMRVDELKPDLERVYDEQDAQKGELDDSMNRLFKETRPLRRLLESGDFGPDSVFMKTLKTMLTARQAEAYDEAARGDAGQGKEKEAKRKE